MPIPGRQGQTPPEVLLSDCYGVILVWFLMMAGAGALLKAMTRSMAEDPELGRLLAMAVFSSVTALMLIYKVSRKFSFQGFWANVGFPREGRPRAKTVLVPALIGIFFSSVASFVMAARPIEPVTPLSKVLDAAQSPFLIGVFLALAVLAAPLVEEIIFRGYFFYVASKVRGEAFAVCVISLVFAFLHMGQYWGDWPAIGMVVLLGFVLTGLRAWTKTTLASVVAHYVYNIGVTVLPIVMEGVMGV